ncbi:RNA-binding transcriptional accessory protein [bacterium]|nr:RNA-binding transcriptional accessory protein [bacterium]
MPDLCAQLAGEFKRSVREVSNVIKLIDDGNTIPFIARYRKEMHGGMDDQTLRELGERLAYLRHLQERREEVASALQALGKYDEPLRQALDRALTLAEIEDIYRPYRPKRRTRATVAKERGLEPLALKLWEQRIAKGSLADLARPFVCEDKGVADTEQALAGAADIIAEYISDSAEVRGRLRDFVQDRAVVKSSSCTDGDNAYSLYADYQESVKTIPPHRVLAINRGEKEKALKVSLVWDSSRAQEQVVAQTVRRGSVSSSLVEEAARDAYGRLLAPALEREVRGMLTDRANEQAIKMFALNLKPLLLQPPVKGKVILGFDPAYRTGCKLAVVSPIGKVLDTAVIYPTPPHCETQKAKSILKALIAKHNVEVIAIGNGTASKESEIFVAGLLEEVKGVAYAMVSEAGASVYSASKLAAEEFPQYDVSLRSAVSIARRLQDPLAELVKIDPKSIGVGQYQHDVPAARLDEALGGTVEDCVNSVGVDLNTASAALLQRVAGLSAVTAQNIVKYREANGPFASRRELLKVAKIGPKCFEQCAGFLRVPDSAQILDNTGVHPESYAAATALLKRCGLAVKTFSRSQCAELAKKIASVDMSEVAKECQVGLVTLQDIAKELLKPGRDPREELPPVLLRTDIMSLEDLEPGMTLRGTVRNVVDFGAFVDIGVHQDGLVHISELSDSYVRHPFDVVSVGDIVDVTVLSVDVAKKRISLSMRQQ